MRLHRLAALLLVQAGACKSPSEAEQLEKWNGVFTLTKAGGSALPFAEISGTTRSQLLSGSLALTWQTYTNGTCSFSTAYRDSVSGQAATQGTETTACTFEVGRDYYTGPLQFPGGVAAGRFVHHLVWPNWTLFGLDVITVHGAKGVTFEFRR